MPARVLHIVHERRADGVVADVALHGAKALNVVDEHLLRAATAEFRTLTDDESLRSICLHGRDDRAFIGGADLAALHALDRSSAEAFIRTVHEFCAALREAPVPVIGVLRGYCLGAGLEIAAACDIRIGDPSVRCGMPEVRVGVPSVVEAALLPGLIGWGKARELMLRGHLIDAREAQAIGILQHLVEAPDLAALSHAITDDILAGAPLALAAQKKLFRAWEELPMSDAIERGVHAFVDAYAGDEPQRAIAHFYAARGKAPP